MRVLVSSLAAVLALACSGGSASNDSPVVQAGAPSEAEKAAAQRSIDSTLAALVAAMKTGDATAAANAYTDDAIVMSPGAPAWRGRAAIIEGNKGMLAAMTISDASIRTSDLILAGDYAIETGNYEMMMQPKSGKAMKDIGKYLAVWRRQPDGNWKMIRDIFNSDQGM